MSDLAAQLELSRNLYDDAGRDQPNGLARVIETPPVEHLLRSNARLREEVSRLRADKQKLHRRLRDMRASRDQWRSEARGWKWSAMKARG